MVRISVGNMISIPRSSVERSKRVFRVYIFHSKIDLPVYRPSFSSAATILLPSGNFRAVHAYCWRPCIKYDLTD